MEFTRYQSNTKIKNKNVSGGKERKYNTCTHCLPRDFEFDSNFQKEASSLVQNNLATWTEMIVTSMELQLTLDATQDIYLVIYSLKCMLQLVINFGKLCEQQVPKMMSAAWKILIQAKSLYETYVESTEADSSYTQVFLSSSSCLSCLTQLPMSKPERESHRD